MARQLRIQYPGAVYHVTCRGNERRDIYRDEKDYQGFLEKLADSLNVYHVSLMGYVCMTNHFHLLVATPEGNLSDFMRHFNISYTTAFNHRHKRSGHLYQGRYKSYLIQAKNYLDEVSRYIHLNPVRIKKHFSKRIETKIKILMDFVYSSFTGYLSLDKRQDYIDYKPILDRFGGDNHNGRKKYSEYMLKGIKTDDPSPLELGKGSGIVGSVDFKDYIKNEYLDTENAHREQPHLKRIRAGHDPEEIITVFCSVVEQDRVELCRRGKNSIERAMLMEILYRYCSITQPEIGRLVGGIDYSAVSVARKRLRLKMEDESVLREYFEGIINDLSRIKI
ncbi:MAG: hypothetical protein GY699_00635 [Desulfobacteraceae bacterium]|nr:hypothetical protein [Desulfobacteraceae bacterium]